MVFSSSRRDPIIKKIVILRHGRTTWNAERRFQGQEDPPLDEVGIAQAIKAASILNSIEYAKVVSSDLIRAQKTAEMVVGSSRVETDIAFRETHCGNWQGRTWPEIEKTQADQLAAWSLSEDIRPGETGETRSEVAQRFTAGIDKYISEIEPGQTLLVVTHGGAARAGISQLLGLPKSHWGVLGVLSNCSWSLLSEQPGKDQRWRLDEYNAGSLPEPAIGDDV